MYSQASYDLYSMIRGRTWAWITPNNNPWPCPLYTECVAQEWCSMLTLLIGCSSSNSRDIDHGTPNWVLYNFAQVLWSSLSGDVDFNIQPAEARLSRVIHIELWAAPDYFSLRLHCIEHLSSPTLRAVKIIESLFEKALGKQWKWSGAMLCWLNGKESTNRTCVFSGFVKDNG